MTRKDVTSRWRWVVLASSFCAILITGYGAYQVGVMKVALLDHLDSDVSLTTWLMSYYSGCYALAAPVGSIVLNVTSCRTCVVLSGIVCLLGFVLSSLVTDLSYLFLTITLLGTGQAMCGTASIVILGYYFPERASIVSGVSISGGALAAFMHPPLLQSLVDRYGLQGALLLSGAIAFQGCVFGALMRPCSLEQKVIQHRRGGNVVQKLCTLCAGARGLHTSPLTSRAMVVHLVSAFAFSLSLHSLIVLLPYHLIHVGGLTSMEASVAVSLCGIGSFFSRLAAGFLAHDPRVGHVLVYCGLIGVQVLVSLSAPSLIARGFVGSCAYNLMLGLYSGGFFTLLYPMGRELVGLERSPSAYGLILCIVGVGALLGAPFTELVQGQSSNPYVLFGFIGALFSLSAVLGSLLSSLTPASPASTADQDQPSPHFHSSHQLHPLGHVVHVHVHSSDSTAGERIGQNGGTGSADRMSAERSVGGEEEEEGSDQENPELVRGLLQGGSGVDTDI